VSEIDILREASRLVGLLALICWGLFGWKKRKAARSAGIALSLLAGALALAEIAGLGIAVKTDFPAAALDAATWLLLAIGLWCVVNAEFEKKWGDGGA
jgi:hypothetical protein